VRRGGEDGLGRAKALKQELAESRSDTINERKAELGG
jgi:hypothetical protein